MKLPPEISIPLALLLIVFIGVIYVTNNDINYEIKLIDADIEQGQDAILMYEINNGWFSGDKNNLEFKYYIPGVIEGVIAQLGNIGRGQTIKDSVYIYSSELPPGEYTVWTEIKYYEEGIGRTKFLTLPLTIYPKS